MLREQFRGENVCPEDVVFAERYLFTSTRAFRTHLVLPYVQVNRISMMSLSRKHGHRMMEDITSTLHTLVQPRSSMTLLVNWNRKRLATTVINCIDDSNVELFGMLRQVVGT
jgi:hypothetical protein